MGLLKIARLQRAHIASSPPRAAMAEHDRASGHAIPHHRLAQQWQSMTAPSPRAIPSPSTSALIVAERRHSAVTRYAERSGACRDSTHPLLTACRRYATTASIPTQHQRRAYSVRSISPTQHQRRAYGASETRYCIITPSARRDSGGRMGHRRPTITRRFGDALLPPRGGA